MCQDDREIATCCFYLVRMGLYFLMANAIYFSSMIAVTEVYSYDLWINNNTQYAISENLATPEVYGFTLFVCFMMFVAGVFCTVLMGFFQKADLIGFISSYIFWVSLVDMLFVKSLQEPSSIKLRCNETCDFDSLESDYLNDFSFYLLMMIFTSIYGIVHAGFMASNSINDGCDGECNNPVINSIWYMFFPFLFMLMIFSLCSENSNSYSNDNKPVEAKPATYKEMV